MKRTKRYGGFLVGDRVQYKKCGFIDIEGEVVGFCNGNIIMAFRGDSHNRLSFAPNQLINLTRQEEEAEKRVIAFYSSDLPKEEVAPLNTLYEHLCANIDVWCDTLKQQLKESIEDEIRQIREHNTL